MENAVEALQMAFAAMMFVVALSTAMMTMGQARSAAEHVFYYTDKTNFYERMKNTKNDEGRIVSAETIIPTIYRYYKEEFNVVILDKDDKIVARYSIDEDNAFRESNAESRPWAGNIGDTKKRIDLDMEGITYIRSNSIDNVINQVPYEPSSNFKKAGEAVYSDNHDVGKINGDFPDEGLREYLTKNKFREKFIEQRYSGKQVTSGDGETMEITKGSTKLWIIYKQVEEI